MCVRLCVCDSFCVCMYVLRKVMMMRTSWTTVCVCVCVLACVHLHVCMLDDGQAEGLCFVCY